MIKHGLMNNQEFERVSVECPKTQTKQITHQLDDSAKFKIVVKLLQSNHSVQFRTPLKTSFIIISDIHYKGGT